MLNGSVNVKFSEAYSLPSTVLSAERSKMDKTYYLLLIFFSVLFRKHELSRATKYGFAKVRCAFHYAALPTETTPFGQVRQGKISSQINAHSR